MTIKPVAMIFAGALAVTGATASAEPNYFVRSSLRGAQASTEGSTFSLQQLDAGIYSDAIPYLKPGLSAIVEYSGAKTNLFDTYAGTGLNFDLLAQGPEIGSLLPFLLVRIPVFHNFQASGKVTRHITNGKDRSDGSIEFPDPSGWTSSTTSPREDTVGYELKGNALGVGVDLGCNVKLSDHFAVTGSVGYSWRNLVITGGQGSDYGMIGAANYAYDQRHGIQFSGKNISEGFHVDADRKSRFFGAASLNLGVEYKI